MKLRISDPHARTPRREPRQPRAVQRRTNWAALRLRLALARLDALTRARHPDKPYRYLFHETETGRLLFLRWRHKRGAFAGPDDRRDPAVLTVPPDPEPFPRPPAIPLPAPLPGRLCALCLAVIGPYGELCVRCAQQTLRGVDE